MGKKRWGSHLGQKTLAADRAIRAGLQNAAVTTETTDCSHGVKAGQK
jgi:hypothetical protein